MKKTWDEKYFEWRKRSGWPVHVGTKFAYHAGRRHQREALREQGRAWRERIEKLFRVIDDRNSEIAGLTRQRDEYKARNNALTNILNGLSVERNESNAKCQSLLHEKFNLQIQNGSLKNQIRILRETIVELESRTWWQKLCCRWRTKW